MSTRAKRITLVVVIELVIATGFVIGADWASSETRILYHSYFADVFLPFGFYFLLVLAADKAVVLQPWWNRGMIVFLVCALSETLQFFSIYALARVFDPWDYVMYGAGVALAILLDRGVFHYIFSFWRKN